MNVLMLVKNSEIGGVASCTASLAKGLIRYKNANVVIGVTEGECVDAMLSEYDTVIIDFSSKSLKGIIHNYNTLKRIVKEFSIDVIHAQNRVPAFYAAIYCLFHKNTKYIWSNHLVPIPSDFVHRITTFYGACAVAEGIAGKRMLENEFKISPSKVKVVNLGVDFDTFRKTPLDKQQDLRTKYNICKDEKIVLLYGRLHPVKGHLFLLRALNKAGVKDKKIKIVFPGENDSYKNEIIEYAKSIGLDDYIIFPGYVNGAEWLSISDLMCLPSKQEGFGIVNVESFVLGVPVIRTRTAGYEDMKDLCFGIDYDDTNTLAELLKAFFADSPIFDEKAKYAQENCKRFSLESYTNGYYEIYEEALKNEG